MCWPLGFQLLQMAFENRAQMLVLLRQLQRLAQMRDVLVPVEAGLVRGDLEENAARRAEIDRQK